MLNLDWKESAACRAADPLLFEIIDEDHPQYSGDPEEYKKVFFYNAERALSYCLSCPVLDECHQNASPEDLMFTVRGGQLPAGPHETKAEGKRRRATLRAVRAGRKPGQRGRPKKSKPNSGSFKKQYCPQKHKLPIPGGNCYQCDRNRRSYERARIRNLAKLMG